MNVDKRLVSAECEECPRKGGDLGVSCATSPSSPEIDGIRRIDMKNEGKVFKGPAKKPGEPISSRLFQ